MDATLKSVQQLLAEEAHLSPALRSILEVMIMLVKLMANRLSLNSRNSSQPPSTDRFAKGDKPNKDDTRKKSGGQPGRVGTTLKKIDDPDEIKALTVDRSSLPPGEYRLVGFDCRQVFDIDIRRLVTEYKRPHGERNHQDRRDRQGRARGPDRCARA